MARIVSYSDGRAIRSVIEIWDEQHGRAGNFRAFWVECDTNGHPIGSTGSPVVGYCSPGGTHRTVRAAVADAKRRYPQDSVWRNGRRLA